LLSSYSNPLKTIISSRKKIKTSNTMKEKSSKHGKLTLLAIDYFVFEMDII